MKLQRTENLFATVAFLLLIGIFFLKGKIRIALFIMFVILMMIKYRSRKKKGLSNFRRSGSDEDKK